MRPMRPILIRCGEPNAMPPARASRVPRLESPLLEAQPKRPLAHGLLAVRLAPRRVFAVEVAGLRLGGREDDAAVRKKGADHVHLGLVASLELRHLLGRADPLPLPGEATLDHPAENPWQLGRLELR